MNRVIFEITPDEYKRLENKIEKLKVIELGYLYSQYNVVFEDSESVYEMLELLKEIRNR